MRQSKVGIASMILGIVGILTACIGVGIVFSIIGVILGIVGMTKKDAGHGTAIAGLTCSVVGLVVFLFAAILFDDDSKDSESITYSGNTQSTETSSTETTSVSIGESEIYNDNGISITVTGIEQGSTETKVKFTVSSESDKDYSISAHSYAVNGLMAGSNMYGYESYEVPAGKNATMSISLDNDWMKQKGITTISEINIIFWAYYDDFKDWDTGNLVIKTDQYSEDIKYSPAGDKVYSDDNAAVWYLGADGNEYYFAIKNKSNYNANYTVENGSVNDWSYEITDYTYDLYSEPIQAGAYEIISLEIDDDFMSENGISDVENIEFDILLEDAYWDYSGSMWEHKTDKITIEN